MDSQQQGSQESADQAQVIPGKEFLRGVAADILKAQHAASSGETGEGQAGPTDLEAPQGDATETALAPSEPQAPAHQPDGGNAASRIQQLLAENKQLKGERDADVATRQSDATELADYRKEKDSRDMREAIREALQGEGRSEEEGSYGRDDTDAVVEKVVAVLAVKNGMPDDDGTNIIMEERKVLRELSAIAPELQLNPAQLDAVATMRQKSPGLDAVEALALAEMRQPSLFPAADRRGPDPQTHSTTRPRGRSSSRTPETTKQREVKHLNAAFSTQGDERQANAMAALSQNPTVQKALNHFLKKG